jgi:hypothetical protein
MVGSLSEMGADPWMKRTSG